MTKEEKFEVYEKMRGDVERLYCETAKKAEYLKKEEKTKTVSYKEALSWKFYYKIILDMYEKYGLR